MIWRLATVSTMYFTCQCARRSVRKGMNSTRNASAPSTGHSADSPTNRTAETSTTSGAAASSSSASSSRLDLSLPSLPSNDSALLLMLACKQLSLPPV